MTAALDHAADEEAQRSYPERITVRVSQPVYPIYDAVDESYDADGISQTHRIWAMLDLFWAHGTPAQRRAIQDRARELEQSVHETANQRRSVGRALAHAQRRTTTPPGVQM